MSDHALRFEDVRFRYPDTSRDALAEVTLDIDEGTFALAVRPDRCRQVHRCEPRTAWCRTSPAEPSGAG
jgi:hypothetical protein